MSERKTLCDLGMVTLDFGWSDVETPDPGNTFRLTFLVVATVSKPGAST
jgi:hypothetical protein